MEGQISERRTTQDLLHGLLVDREVERLADEHVLERAVLVRAQGVDHDVRVDRAVTHDGEPVVLCGDERGDLVGRHDGLPELHVDRPGDDLLEHGLGLLPECDLDRIDVGLAQRVGRRIPGRVPVEYIPLIRYVLGDHVRAVGDGVLTQLGAVRQIVEVLHRLRGGEAGQGEDVREIAGRLDQRELHRRVVDRGDPLDLVALDIRPNRLDVRGHLSESGAVLVQPDDGRREVVADRRALHGVAHPLHSEHHVAGDDRPFTGRRIPDHAVAQRDRVRRAIGRDAAVLDGRDLGRDVRLRGRPLDAVVTRHVVEQTAQDRALDLVVARAVRGRRVEVEHIGTTGDDQRAPGCALTLGPRCRGLRRRRDRILGGRRPLVRAARRRQRRRRHDQRESPPTDASRECSAPLFPAPLAHAPLSSVALTNVRSFTVGAHVREDKGRAGDGGSARTRRATPTTEGSTTASVSGPASSRHHARRGRCRGAGRRCACNRPTGSRVPRASAARC